MIFKTYDTSPDCLPINFYVEDVRLIKEVMQHPKSNKLCAIVYFYDEAKPEYIPRSEGDRLLEMMEIIKGKEFTISLERDEIFKLARFAEENPQDVYDVTFEDEPIPGAEEGRN